MRPSNANLARIVMAAEAFTRDSATAVALEALRAFGPLEEIRITTRQPAGVP